MSGLGGLGLIVITVGSSLLLSAALLGNWLRLGLGLGLLGRFLVGLRLDLGLFSTAFLLGLLNGGLIVNFRLRFDLLGAALLLGRLSFGGSFFISLRLWLGLLGSSLCLGSFDGRSIFVVVGWLLGFALPGLLSGRSLSRLLVLFVLRIVISLLATTLLGRLLGRCITPILGMSALDICTGWRALAYLLFAVLVGLGLLLRRAATNT